MFGGFPPSFYTHYHELVPKSEPVEEYEQRQQLYELFHHLNHMLMFGGVRLSSRFLSLSLLSLRPRATLTPIQMGAELQERSGRLDEGIAEVGG
jgi:hypothetical protein